MTSKQETVSSRIRTSTKLDLDLTPEDTRLSADYETAVDYGHGRADHHYIEIPFKIPVRYKVKKTHFLDDKTNLSPENRQREEWTATASDLVFRCAAEMVKGIPQVYPYGNVLVEVDGQPVWKYGRHLAFCAGGEVRNRILSADLNSDFTNCFVKDAFSGKDGNQIWQTEQTVKEVLRPLSAKVSSLAKRCESLIYTLNSDEIGGFETR